LRAISQSETFAFLESALSGDAAEHCSDKKTPIAKATLLPNWLINDPPAKIDFYG
jgi:hypothetical protein